MSEDLHHGDRLETIFYWQRTFQEELAARRGVDFDQSTALQKHALALMVELAEVVEEARYKWWKNAEPIRLEKLREELVDVLHFFVAMCLTADMTADDLFRGYLQKNAENFQRQQGLSSKPGYGPLDSGPV